MTRARTEFRAWLCAFGALALARAAFGATSVWDPVAPEDLKSSTPTVYAEAPAEAIFRRITVDDTDFPGERRFHEYDRYKIFDPEKAAGLTRISEQSVTADGQEYQGGVEIAARLSRPDGSVQEFGREAIQERPIIRSAAEQGWVQRLFGSGGVEVKEKFLAVGGIEKGSVLDIQISYRVVGVPWFQSIGLQQAETPARRLDLTYLRCTNDDWTFREFTLNGLLNHAESRADAKAPKIYVSAQNVAALYAEPFSGPLPDYALTFVVACTPLRLSLDLHHTDTWVKNDPKAGPWAPYATKMSLFESDRARTTTRVKQLAAQLTAQPGTDEEKARRIHRLVEDLYQRFLSFHRTVPAIPNNTVTSLDQLLDFERNSRFVMGSVDFVWLAVTLYRTAGFEAQTVMLPNRNFSKFDPRFVADAFLPFVAARVRIGEKWMLSFPADGNRFAFGELPWEQEGQAGLVAAINHQEFVPIPLTAAGESRVVNSGTFTLSAEGALTGPAHRSYTGHSASVVRNQVLHLSAERQKNYFRRRLESDLKPAEITVKSVTGIDDPEVSLRVDYEVNWPDYAVATKNRLIFRPAVFQASAQSPFSEQTRHYAFEFPYKWTETDHLTVAPPPGFRIESKQAPASIPGDLLGYRCSISLETATGTIHFDRDFVSNLVAAPATANGPIKSWYDAVAARDQFELVFQGRPPKAGAETDAPP